MPRRRDRSDNRTAVGRTALRIGALLFCIVGPIGCKPDAEHVQTAPASPPYVLTAKPVPAIGSSRQLSATVRARVESPLAFQVSGRIIARKFDAGARVEKGQVIFELDPNDLDQAVRVAEADVAAAEIGLRTAAADADRARQLHLKGVISDQALERAELNLREAKSRLEAASARAQQARNSRGYALLVSPSGGVLVDVTGEVGQVVSAGQAIALLAQNGEREVEVSFPDALSPPQNGIADFGDGREIAITLREASPTVEPIGRTRRARYTLNEIPRDLVLGIVVRVRFDDTSVTPDAWLLPIGAIDERGNDAQVWLIDDGQVRPLPVAVLGVDGERAKVRGKLSGNEEVVALGTHLLRPGMAIRRRAR
jgi:RND family efflux transporter MFP subunit